MARDSLMIGVTIEGFLYKRGTGPSLWLVRFSYRGPIALVVQALSAWFRQIVEERRTTPEDAIDEFYLFHPEVIVREYERRYRRWKGRWWGTVTSEKAPALLKEIRRRLRENPDKEGLSLTRIG